MACSLNVWSVLMQQKQYSKVFLHNEPRAQLLAFMATTLMLQFTAKENDHQAIPLNCSAIPRQFM